MNLRVFLLILAVFLSVLRICYVEDPEAETVPKPSSNGQNNSPKVEEENDVKAKEKLADSSSSSSSYTTSSPSSSLSASSSSSSSSPSSLSTDTSTESLSTFSSKKSISSSELEQIVLPTVAPATPHFDTETITSSLSVIISVSESIQQEKRPEEEPEPQHEFLLVSDINSEKEEAYKSKAKGKAAEIHESKIADEKLSKDEPVTEKPQADQSITVTLVPTPEALLEKKDADSSVSVSKDEKQEEAKDNKKEEAPEEKKEEPREKEKREDKSKEDDSKDKDVDSITAELKQAEEETKSTSEDMPSFDEFKRQHLQEEEKQKSILKQQQEVKAGTEIINKPKPRKIKQRKQNNYASIDCGAKILKANPEASNIFSILQDNRDIYMLNPCRAKIWFIVELCDNVQVKTIEIANFELFSSTPESFKVYVSGRYPTREWTLLGTFQARDERNLQSFPLDEPIYAKYIKVEMLSHFGSEHYCPLSLFRVFGISMMEELEDHEAGGQDDADAVDHDDDTAQVLPPDPSVKEDDKKTQSNILATVGDTLFNMVKVAAKKLTGVIDSEKNLTSDNLGTSTVAPSSSIVSSTTSKEQDAKPSIVTLIPSEEEDNIYDTKQDNKTTNATTSTDPKKPEGQENARDNTTFYDKIDPDSSRGSKTTTAFSGCELFVRMLGHSGFGCMMGKVLYSKRKHRGFTPREENQAKQKTSAKAPPGSDGRTQTTTDKRKEDSKKNDEKKDGEKESEKVEEKGKKSGKEKVDDTNTEPIIQKEGKENKVIFKGADEIKQPESSIETKSSSDLKTETVSEGNKQTSINRAVDPSIIVQPSEVQPPVIKPCEPSSEEKGTPILTTTSVLTTQPSGDISESKSTQTTTVVIESTLTHIEKPKEEQSESETRKTIDDVSKVKPDVKVSVSSNEETREDIKSESAVSKSEETVSEVGSSTTSTVDQSSPGVLDTCTSVDSFDKSLIKPSQSSSLSECKAPSIATPSHKDVDVLEFKLLDSAGREGTAHLEKPPDKPVEPDKPAQPDQPVSEKEPEKETKEEKSNATLQSSSENSLVQDTSDVTRASPTDDLTVSTSSSSVEPAAKPSVVSIPATSPEASEQPTNPPDVKPSEPESITPLPPPPVDKVPIPPPSGSIEASISDDLSVLSKTPNSATAGVPGLASSGAQKESIFMRLTNRIKALEQNLTLSTLYMEKLNQKYRKIVEDMQKNFDKKVNLLTNATRKAEAVIKSQKEQILGLQAKVDDTSREMKEFNKQLKSLNIQVMERHIIGLFLEVILIMILFIVFRRWDRARIRRDILRESRTNGTVLTSHNHTEDRALGKILNGQLSGREQLQRSFANHPNEPEIIGPLSESVAYRHKEEFFPPMDAKKKRNRKRPKSGVITTETSQPKTVSESTNQTPPSSVVSVTAGLLFNPTRSLLNGFKRSKSWDDCQINRKSSLPSTSRLQKTKSLNVIPENSHQTSLPTGSAKKGRVPTPPPPPPSPQKYWTAGSQPSSSKLMQKKGKGVNGTHPYV